MFGVEQQLDGVAVGRRCAGGAFERAIARLVEIADRVVDGRPRPTDPQLLEDLAADIVASASPSVVQVSGGRRPVSGLVYAAVALGRKKKAGGLPDKVLLAVTPDNLYAFKLKTGRKGYTAEKEVARWQRAGLTWHRPLLGVPGPAGAASSDMDRDGLRNTFETGKSLTNPRLADTDRDVDVRRDDDDSKNRRQAQK